MFFNSFKLCLNLKLLLKRNCLLNRYSVNGLHTSAYNLCEVNDKPIKYTTSDAHLKHRAYENFRFSDEEIAEEPRYQRPILMVCFSIFLIYFGYLREPNDIDAKLGANLFETVPELELPMVESTIKSNEILGLDSTELKKRYQELVELRDKVNNKNKK